MVRVDHSRSPQVLHVRVRASRTAVSATSTADVEKVRTVPCSLESKQKQLNSPLASWGEFVEALDALLAEEGELLAGTPVVH